jgi:hypothetical protein
LFGSFGKSKMIDTRRDPVERSHATGKRLGRSPGKGDAVVMCWSEGYAAAVSRQNAWKLARPVE